MRWDEVGAIAGGLVAVTVVIPWLVRILIGPLIDEKVKSVVSLLDARFKHIEKRLDDHIDNHGRYRR